MAYAWRVQEHFPNKRLHVREDPISSYPNKYGKKAVVGALLIYPGSKLDVGACRPRFLA